MLKNKKGMTLVEMVVTIAVFSIASLILITGFSTVIKYMGEASAIKNTSNEVYTLIESEESEAITSENVNIKITLENDVIDDRISLKTAEKSIHNDADSYKVKLSKLNKKIVFIDPAKTFYEEVKATLEDCLDIDNIKWYSNYNGKLYILWGQGVSKEDYPELTNKYMSNDIFRRYFYVMNLDFTAYPKVDQEIINKCNEIFDEMHENDPLSVKNNVYKAKLENLDIAQTKNVFYMKPIYMQDKKFAFLTAECQSTTPLTWDIWRTRLIYNPDDEHWYYKVFTYENLASESYFSLSGFNTNEQWEKLKADFKDATKWRKIVIE